MRRGLEGKTWENCRFRRGRLDESDRTINMGTKENCRFRRGRFKIKEINKRIN